METKGNKWEIITLWNAMVNHDERGPYTSIGSFTSELTAKEFTKGKCWYGGNGHAKQTLGVRLYHVEGKRDLIFNDVYEIGPPVDLDLNERLRKDKRRKELLAEMSDDDKDILGLK